MQKLGHAILGGGLAGISTADFLKLEQMDNCKCNR